MSVLNPETIVGQMRLNTGDFIEDEPYLEDAIYLWMYERNGNSVLEGSIEALETIINYLSLAPTEWKIDSASEKKQSIASLENRLNALKAKRWETDIPPIVIKTDRKNWDDFNDLFGGC